MHEDKRMNKFLEMSITTPEDLNDLIPGFIRRRKQELGEITMHFKNENFIEIQRIGHKLKGHGVSYGFKAVSEAGKELEIFAEQKNKDKTWETIEYYQEFLGKI